MGAAGRIEIQVAAQTEEARRRIVEFGQTVDGSLRKIADGLRVGLGIDLAQRFIGALQRIPQAIEAAVQKGVAFNLTLEDSQLGIAAILKQFNPEAFKNFDDALKASAQAIELLKQKAKESPATFQQLVAAFQANAGAAMAANIPLQKQVDLVVLMSQALAGLGIRSEQIIQESRALLTGNINEDAQAARILGITKAQIERAKQQGQLFEFLTAKMAAFAEAGKRGADTFSTRLSNLGDTLDQVLGQLTKPIFDTLKEGFDRLTKAFSDSRFQRDLEGIANRINVVVAAGMRFAEFATNNAGLLAAGVQSVAIAATGLTAVVAGFAAFKAGLTALTVAMAPIFGLTAIQSVKSLAAGLAMLAAEPLTAVLALKGALLGLGAALAGISLGVFVSEIEVTFHGVTAQIKQWVQIAWLTIFDVWERIKAYFAGSATWIHDTLLVEWQRIVVMLREKTLEIAGLLNKVWPGPKIDTQFMEGQLAAAREKLATWEKQRDERLAKNTTEGANRLAAARAANRDAMWETLFGAAPKPIGEKATQLPQVNVEGAAILKVNEELLDEIHRRYQQAVLDKEALALAEFDAMVARVDAEVEDVDRASTAKYQLEVELNAKLKAIREQAAEDKRQELEKAAADEARRQQEAAQRALRLANDELRLERDKIALRRAELEANFRMPEYEKKSDRLKLLQQEIDLLEQLIQKLTALRDAQKDDAAREVIQQQITGFEAERRGLGIQRVQVTGGPEANDFSDQFEAKITSMLERMGTLAQQAANAFENVFMGAISSISNGLTGLIMQTITWQQFLLQVGTAILTSIINAIITMGVQWIATQLMMAIAGKTIQASMVAASAPLAAAASAVWAAPATLATIASYGGAAAAAPGFILAAQGTVLASSMAQFKKGGWTGDGDPNEIAGFAHKREVVFEAPVVNRLGKDRLMALRRGGADAMAAIAAMANEARGADGAAAAGITRPMTSDADAMAAMEERRALSSAGGQPGVSVAVEPAPVKVAVVNDPSQLKRLMESEEGWQILRTHLTRRGHEIGLQT